MVDMIVKSKIKDVLQGKGYKVSSELYIALSDKVNQLIEKASQRAEANGRKTILVRDL